MSLERVPEAFLVDVRDFLRVLALEPWQQETSIGVDHEDSAFELRTFGVENSLSYLRERPDLEELERSVAEIGALLTAEHSGEADFRSEPWGELRDRARDASFHVPPLDSFSISDTPVNTDAVTLGGEETFLRIEILGTYEIFTHQLFEVRCESVVAGRARDEVTMPVFGYDLVDLGRWLIGDPEVLRREGPTLDAAGPRYWFDEAAPLTFDRTEDTLSIRLAIEEARLDAVLTGVSREQMQRAGRALQATREHHLAYRRELFDIPFDDERVTLIIMDEDWQTAHDRIRREERTALPSRLLSRLRRLWR